MRKLTLPDDLDQNFINALQEVLCGLTKVLFKMEDMRAPSLEGRDRGGL